MGKTLEISGKQRHFGQKSGSHLFSRARAKRNWYSRKSDNRKDLLFFVENKIICIFATNIMWFESYKYNMNKKSILTLLALLLLVAAPQVSAQKNRRPSSKRTTATTKKKSTASSTKSPAKGSGSKSFEGTLLYRTYEHHGSMVKAFSNGMAYNGEHTILVTIKGSSLHIDDQSIHMHTIILPDQGIGYQYSDIAKQGIKAKLSFLNDYLLVLDPNERGLTKESRASTIKATGETVEYKGDRCSVISGELINGDVKTETEIWKLNKYRVSPTIRYAYAGLPVGGIMRKGIYNQIGTLPLGIKMKSTVAYELMVVQPHAVKASAMRPPSDIHIGTATDNKQMMALYKANNASMKKLKLKPKKMKGSEIKRDLHAQWSFADEWMAHEYNPNNYNFSDDLKKILPQLPEPQENNTGGLEESGNDGFESDLQKSEQTHEDDKKLSEADRMKLKRMLNKEAKLAKTVIKQQARLWKQADWLSNSSIIWQESDKKREIDDYNKNLKEHLENYEELLQLKIDIKTLRHGEKYIQRHRDNDERDMARKIRARRASYEKKIKNSHKQYNTSYFVDSYRRAEDELKKIKNSDGSYRGLSLREQIDEAKKLQSEMKKIRKRCESETGSKLPNANKDLENWNIRNTRPWSKID